MRLCASALTLVAAFALAASPDSSPPTPVVAPANAATPSPITVREVPGTDGKWQEARGVVDASPARVRAWLEDFARWPEWFRDVKSIQVLGHENGITRIRFESRIFARRLIISVRFTDAGLAFRGDDGSVRTEGLIWLVDDGSGRTDVTIRNYAHVGGLLGALVPGRLVRDRQRDKLRADLGDLQRFARRQPNNRFATETN